MLWIAVAIALAVILKGSAGIVPTYSDKAAERRRAAVSKREARRSPEAIWFVDGPLAGRIDHLQPGADGLPPFQFCALVNRSDREGGDYTLPYQRGLISEAQHAWQYTQGWSAAVDADTSRHRKSVDAARWPEQPIGQA